MSFISLKSQIGDILVRIVDKDECNFILEVKRTSNRLPSKYKFSIDFWRIDEEMRFYSVIMKGMLYDSKKIYSCISSRGIKIIYDGASLDFVLIHPEESLVSKSEPRKKCL